MGDVSLELIYKRLEQLQAGQEAIHVELRSIREETTQKIGSLAQTLVAVQRDVNGLRRDFTRLSDTVATLGIAMDAHTDRFDHIEKHLGIGGTPN